MERKEKVKEQFLKDVSGHKMKVMHCDGIYRHLNFSKGSAILHFNITTWPGYLCVSGDMGCFVFSRLRDMFEFFRMDKLKINCQYWAEKLVAINKCCFKEYSPDVFREKIKEICDEWDVGKSNVKALMLAVAEEVLSSADDGEEEARKAADSFRFETEDEIFSFTDLWEVDLTEYTYNFLWCLYAIVWGIQQYDKLK